MNIIVFTDGEASDHNDLRDTLIKSTQELDQLKAKPDHIGIQFFQVGVDKQVDWYLKTLDDNIKEHAHSTRDIVDKCTFDTIENGMLSLTSDGVAKTLLGGIDKDIDAQEFGLEM